MEETLAFGDLAGPIGLFLMVFGTCLVLTALLRPQWVWPLLALGAIVGSGPKLKGYVVFDEIFLLVLVGGALVALVVHGLRSQEHPLRPVQTLVFIAWAAFMAMQSARGMVFERDPRIVRWIVMYLALGGLAYLLNRYTFLRPRNWPLLVVVSTVALYVVYAAVGVYYDITIAPGARYYAQGYVWSGTAGAVFPTVLACPAALMLIEKGRFPTRVLGVLSIAVMGGIGWYYDSRFSWLMIAAYVVLWLSRRMWVVAAGALVAALVFFAGGGFTMQDSRDYFEDQTRWLQLQIARDAAADNWTVAAIGAGVYTHRTILPPYADRAFNRYVSDEKFAGTWLDYNGQPVERGFGATYRTTGLPAFFIDTGFVGIAFFALLFIMRATTIARSGESSRLMWLAALGFGAMAMLIFNPIDGVLFYLLLLPNGLLDELASAPLAITPQGQLGRGIVPAARPLRVATS